MSLQVNGNQPVTYTTTTKAAQPAAGNTQAANTISSSTGMDTVATAATANTLTSTAKAADFDINTINTHSGGMDAIAGGGMDTLTPPEPKVEGNDFKTWGDPHEITGDGLKFDNQKIGDFVKMKSKSGDLILQARQSQVGSNTAVKYNTAFALKIGTDILKYDVHNNNKITINGKEQELNPGASITLPSGGSISRAADGTINIKSAMGDKFNITVHGSDYIDIAGSVSSKRVDGEVMGSLGTFDADSDASNDMRDRNGKIMDTNNTDAFLEEWRVKDGESLF